MYLLFSVLGISAITTQVVVAQLTTLAHVSNKPGGKRCLRSLRQSLTNRELNGASTNYPSFMSQVDNAEGYVTWLLRKL